MISIQTSHGRSPNAAARECREYAPAWAYASTKPAASTNYAESTTTNRYGRIALLAVAARSLKELKNTSLRIALSSLPSRPIR